MRLSLTSCSAILSESSERLRCRGRRPTAAQASATSASAKGDAVSDSPGLDPSEPSRAYAPWPPVCAYGEAMTLSADTGDAGKCPPAGEAGAWRLGEQPPLPTSTSRACKRGITSALRGAARAGQLQPVTRQFRPISPLGSLTRAS